MVQKIITILSTIMFLPFIFGFGEANHKSLDASFINLISTPDQYHDKMVRVIGVVNLEFEGDAIYLSKEHLISGVTKNALWISLNLQALGKTKKELSKYNGQYVLLEGIFNKANNGHMCLFSGSIDNVTRFMPWPPEIIKRKNG